MPTNYQLIADENVRRYGTDIGLYGPTLLADIFTERIHFVYELLQNAEDALARIARAEGAQNFSKRVRFHLYQDRLEFRHFGKAFDEPDVRGISGLIAGTAANDLTRIGRFGIGFKPVYAYTTSPEIHSADKHFQILNYVLPHPVSAVNLAGDETLFILRFDKPDLKPATAFEEIAKCLRELGVRTLLFLKFIEEIHWRVEGGLEGNYRRSAGVNGALPTTTLTSLRGGQVAREEFCLFEQDVEGHPAKVAVAFRLEKDDESGRKEIVGLGNSALVVFFPTKRETKLKFLVQGPYRTTPTRETIHEDDDWNRKLIEQTASLVADSLPKIRDAGLLTPGFLETLPLSTLDFPADNLFRPFYERTKAALKQQPLLPCDGGGLISAAEARLANSQAIRQLLANDQLVFLLGATEPIKWLSGQFTERRTPQVYSYLTDKLGIEEITPEKFAQRFTLNFIERQTDEWVASFYAFLAEQPSLWRKAGQWAAQGQLRDKPFIRLGNNRHVPPFRADNPNAYLPTGEDTEFPIVKREICANAEARAFLVKLEFTEPDIITEVWNKVLPRYLSNAAISSEQHGRDMEKIFKAMRADAGQRTAPFEAKLKETPFLNTVKVGSSEPKFVTASQVYFRTPELELYFSGNETGAWFLEENISDEDRLLLLRLGVKSTPRKREIQPEFNWQKLYELRNGVSHTRDISLKSYELDGLVECLLHIQKLPFEDASKLAHIIWKFLSSASGTDPESFYGHYRWFFYTSQSVKFPAQFIECLKTAIWLPGQRGGLQRPTELALDELPDEFEKNEKLETALGMRPKTIAALAKQTGLDPQMLNYLRDNPDAQNYLQRHMATKRAQENILNQQMPNTGEIETKFIQDKKHPESIESAEQTSESGTKRVHLETRVYVDASESKVDEESKGEAQKRNETGNTGVQKVLEYEKNEGRVPHDKSEKKIGYDVESADSKGTKRFIEVKAISGDWNELGVGMTAPEFQKAQELGEQYWLYVVERAEQDDFKIHTIQNPAHLVKQFFYDRGWKNLSDARI